MAAGSARRARSLTEGVVDALSERIRQGDFHVGEKLPTESSLMASFGVSRTVIREAISRLQAAGLVETRHGIGTFLLQPKGEQALHLQAREVLTMLDALAIFELRIGVESEAAGLAARRRTEAQLQQLRQALDLHAGAVPGQAASADTAFHLQVAQAAGNRYFCDILDQLGEALIARTRLDPAPAHELLGFEALRRAHDEHEAVYQAIARQDADAARAAMRTHLASSRERLRQRHSTESA